MLLSLHCVGHSLDGNIASVGPSIAQKASGLIIQEVQEPGPLFCTVDSLMESLLEQLLVPLELLLFKLLDIELESSFSNPGGQGCGSRWTRYIMCCRERFRVRLYCEAAYTLR